MSSDRSALISLQQKTNAELRYFELVELHFAGETQTCYMCIGKHAIFLVRRNLCGLYPDDESGQLFYAHVERVIEDNVGFADMLLLLNDNRPPFWSSEKLYVVTETRARLVDQLKVAWQTDFTWRQGKVAALNVTRYPLRKKPKGMLRVKPFKGYQEIYHEGYSLHVNSNFTDTANALQNGVYRDIKRDLTLSMHSTQQVPIAYLDEIGRGHIRWVAGEYKQNLTRNMRQVYLIKNSFYLKKMNLANDVACWTGWQLFMKSEQYALVTLILRRQYIPPILDTAQDISISIKCPMIVLNEGHMSDDELLKEAEAIADSIAPLVQNCTKYPTLYRDMIQAKLDSLLFDEDAMQWIDSLFQLKPRHETQARMFLKSILKVLQDENALNSPDLLNEVDRGQAHPIPMTQDPMSVVTRLRHHAPGMEEDPEGKDKTNPVRNAWHARVSRYFAFCVDGGILGPNFTIHDLTSPFLMTDSSRKHVAEIIYFLLHIRHKNFEVEYQGAEFAIPDWLNDPNFHDYTFNDRMMQSLIELGWIANECAKEDDEKADKSISMEYARFLAEILSGVEGSANLKAAICRQIISCNQRKLPFAALVPALMDLMNSNSLYLKTYSTVVLVNMTGGQESAKNMLMSLGVVPLLGEHLQSKDDDLTKYTLILMTNLTKSVHHRAAMINDGMIPILTELLTSSYSNQFKRDILTELASVIGQLCNDDDTRTTISDNPATLDCFLFVFDVAPEASKLKSKVMFALKQLCVNSTPNKVRVGELVIRNVVKEMEDVLLSSKSEPNMDWATNAVLLLVLLSIAPSNCKILSEDCGIEKLITSFLASTKLGTIELTRERLTQLGTRIDAWQLAQKEAELE